MARRDGVTHKQAARYVGQSFLDLLTQALRLFLHFRRPALAEEVLAAMKQHDACALEIIPDRARQG